MDIGARNGIVVLAVAVASIVLAALAALVQDDLEHVVGYSIIGDAGVVLLAIAALDPAAWAPARIWILAFIVTRSAFAAWAGGDPRPSSGPAAIADLRGWVVRSPILAVAFGLDRRGRRRASRAWPRSRPGPRWSTSPSTARSRALVLIATFAPLAYYGRLLVDRPAAGRPRPVDPAVDWRPAAGRRST